MHSLSCSTQKPPRPRRASLTSNTGRAFGDHQSTSDLALTPSRRKCLRHLKPTPIVARAMIGAHAGALAIMTCCIHASRRAIFLLSKGLNDV